MKVKTKIVTKKTVSKTSRSRFSKGFLLSFVYFSTWSFIVLFLFVKVRLRGNLTMHLFIASAKTIDDVSGSAHKTEP